MPISVVHQFYIAVQQRLLHHAMLAKASCTALWFTARSHCANLACGMCEQLTAQLLHTLLLTLALPYIVHQQNHLAIA
jgi:hypothetical protein